MDGANKQQALVDQVALATRLVSEGKYSELVELAVQIEQATAGAPAVTPAEALELRSGLTELTGVMGHVSAVHRALRQIGTPPDSSYAADGSFDEIPRGRLRGEA